MEGSYFPYLRKRKAMEGPYFHYSPCLFGPCQVLSLEADLPQR